ncbi:BGTF surface domain-containing protein [Halopenitus persicus]|uniref:BGTF surface domain-containing protein n=1 Tax=Halopenitus persicus TaxID=1048396 RepID=UPI0012FD1CA5|nr:BGTF surface domain-containing protein [Halopenitus persicus]
MTVAPGATETVELTHDLENASAGETLDVTVRGDHDRVSGTTKVVDPPHYALTLNETTYDHERNGSRSLPIAGTITNVGGANATDPVSVTVDLGSGSVRRTATVDGLDAGESRSVTVTFDDDALEPLADGTHPIVTTESATDGTANATLSLSTADATTVTDDGTNTTETTDETNTTDDTDGMDSEESTDEDGSAADESDSGASDGGTGTGTSGGGSSGSGGGGGGSGGWAGPVNDGGATVNGSDNGTVAGPDRGIVGPGSVSLAEPIVDATTGGVVEITVTADERADGGALVIGNETTTGYEATARITSFGDADAVTVRFNTYTAGTTAGSVVVLDPASAAAGAAIEFDPQTDQSLRSDALAPGEYPVTVSTAQHPRTAVANPADVGVLTLAPADSGTASSWTTSAGTARSILAADSPVAALSTARAEGTVTRSETVAYGDVAVVRIDSASVSGLLALAGERRPDAGATERFRALTGPDWSPIDGTGTDVTTSTGTGDLHDDAGESPPIDLDLTETLDDDGVNRSPRTIAPGASTIEVVPDHDRDRVTLLVDTAELRFQDGSILDPAAEPAISLGFSVTDPRIQRAADRGTDPVGWPRIVEPRRQGHRVGTAADRPGHLRPLVSLERHPSYGLSTVPSGIETPPSALEITPLSGGSEATTGFTVVERDVRFAADPYDAHAAPDQSFAGSTTLAPGTEFTVRIRPIAASESEFRGRNESVRVAADGTWSATVDLSALTVGDRYRVSVHGLDGVESRPSVEGRIRAADPATEAMTGTPPAAVDSPAAGEGRTSGAGSGAGGGSSGADEVDRPADGSGDASGEAGTVGDGHGVVEVVGRNVESVVGTLAADPTGSLLAAFEAIRDRIDVESIASGISIVLFAFATYRRVR